MTGWEVKLGFELALVADLRNNNTVFDEICRDYEAMLDELARSRDPIGATDLEETVAALEREIATYLLKRS